MKILLFILLISCKPFDYTCNNNEAFHWECECIGVLIEELDEPLIGDGDETWFLCCSPERDSCWHRILEDD